ncbi:MAG: PEGA domain-containing protein [Hyphomonadaceae bacterium]|nr:PEGA domain-containing protein [Hyphomonadaceae bacterium]
MKAVLAIAAAVLASGCATITRGTTQEFVVESTPPGASVTTSNGFECAATPCTFRMPRKEGFTVTVEREGYLSAEATVTSSMSSGGAAGMAGNVLIGGLIGAGVDATSGAMNDLSPNPLQVTLQPVPEEEEATPDVALTSAPLPATDAPAMVAPTTTETPSTPQ